MPSRAVSSSTVESVSSHSPVISTNAVQNADAQRPPSRLRSPGRGADGAGLSASRAPLSCNGASTTWRR